MRDTARLLFVGDISLGGDYARRYGQGSPNWTAPFVDVQSVFRDADLRIANLEEPLFRGTSPRRKKNLLGTEPGSAEALRFLGLTVLCLGNNHITDQGLEGISRTRELLESLGIASFGAGEDVDTARRPVFAEVQNQSFAFLAYAMQGLDVGAEAATETTEGCAPLSLECIETDISEAGKTADHVVVSLHWGYQYDRYPDPEQIAMARQIIDLGARIVFGHHPHVLQGIERYNNGLILYSLGNFFFPDFVRTDGLKFRFPRDSRVTAAVRCDVGKSGVQSFSTVAIKTDRDYRMRVLKGAEATREKRVLDSLSRNLEMADYDSFWRQHHGHTEQKRRRQEEILQFRSEVASISQQLRTRGLVGSLKKLSGQNINETYRLCRRFLGLLSR